MADYDKMPNRAPDDRPELVVMELFIYRDGEEGCEQPALLRAYIDPSKIQTVRGLRWVLHRAASEWAKNTPDGRKCYEDNGEFVSLMDLFDHDSKFVNVLESARRLRLGLLGLSIEMLTPAAICWDENLITE